ncbi:hypothetical protein [Albirhodobacter sp. R86504]|jgi:hypothetical protein|uniref:hypothetical protein n=1 Tax=Albirhodobacter sp. R86504 TaxID=3093848 RepID=UPI00366D4ECD
MIRMMSILMALSPLCLIGPADTHAPVTHIWESTRADAFGFSLGLGSVDPVESLLYSIETYSHGAAI